MSILKNFVNPWESKNFNEGVLNNNVLDNNVLTTIPENEDLYDLANERIDVGKGNLMIIFSRWLKDEYGRRYNEKFDKHNFDKGKETWDYIVMPQQLGDGLDWIKKYKKKYPDIPFHNVVIIAHGKAGQMNIAQPRGHGSWLYGIDVEKYAKGTLEAFTYKYKMMQFLDYLGENMYEGGNILFFACSGGQGHSKLGSVALSLGDFYQKKGHPINMFFNKDESELYAPKGKPREIRWGKGLSATKNTGWLFIQTILEDNKLKKVELKSDLALMKNSDFGTVPYPDVIKPV